MQSNLKIGLDIRKVNDYGIGSYIQQILDGLKKDSTHPQIVLFWSKQQPQEPYLLNQPNIIHRQIKRNRRYPIQGSLNSAEDIDLFHAPHYIAPNPKPETQLLLTIHDLIHHHPPQIPTQLRRFSRRFYYPFERSKSLYHLLSARTKLSKMIKKSRKIISVSHSTAQDVIETFQIPESKLKVIWNSVSDLFFEEIIESKIEEILKKFHLQRSDYAVYCGNDLYHKNIPCLLKSWQMYAQQFGYPPRLILVGPKRKSLITHIAIELGIDKYVQVVGKISKDNLNGLYRGALFTVTASLAEGFGLPVAESLTCRTPVFCSDIQVFREIAGENACFFDPHNPAELADLIHRFINGHMENEIRSKLDSSVIRDQFRQSMFYDAHLEIYNQLGGK